MIASQLFRYGKREQLWPEVRAAFYVPGPVHPARCLQVDSMRGSRASTTQAILLAFVINLVMSALYLSFYFKRRETGRGVSLPVAWLKMVGTALSSVQCYFLIPPIHPIAPSTTHFGPYSFFHFLFAACFVFGRDVHRARQS